MREGCTYIFSIMREEGRGERGRGEGGRGLKEKERNGDHE